MSILPRQQPNRIDYSYGVQQPNIMGGLGQLAQALQQKQKMDDFNALYSASPQYAQGYYQTLGNVQQQEALQQAQQTELAKQDALRRYAESFGGGIGGGVNGGGVDDALIQYARITNDVSPIVKLKLKQAEASLPSAGGATGVLVQQLMRENPKLKFSDALAQVQTGFRQGVKYEGGTVTPIEGLGEARGSVEGETQYGKTRGGLQAEAELAPDIARETAQETAIGKSLGEARAEYDELAASYPQLIETTDRLSKLAQVATYTTAGKWNDAVRRQLGLEVGDAAQAAAEMVTIIDAEVLPLLKPTFGAQFTVNEGQWLRNTMGNPDLSPEEKISQIQARVRGWNNRLKTLETRLDIPQEQRVNTGGATKPTSSKNRITTDEFLESF